VRWLAILLVAVATSTLAQDGSVRLTLTADDWPPRLTAGLDRLAAEVPSVIPRAHESSSDNAEPTQGDDDEINIRRAEPHGLGIVLELGPKAPAESQAATGPDVFDFVSFSPLQLRDSNTDVDEVRLPPKLTLADMKLGVRWELHEPKAKPTRGLVVHLGGNKYVRRALLGDGWAVLTSSGTGRYFGQRQNPSAYEISSEAVVALVGARIAARIDDEMADWPYSLEAVLDYLAKHRPQLPQQPSVVIGFSIGAIGLPAVVARMPDRFSAAVIVAGGADLLRISQTSKKANPGIELHWTPPARADDLFAKLDGAYLSHARLDPYNTAAALGDTPLLVFHASFDQVVTARAGDLLWKRLGKPDRRVFLVGHGQMLRIVMRMQAGEIANWVAATVSGTTP
jgi:predicted esterase